MPPGVDEVVAGDGGAHGDFQNRRGLNTWDGSHGWLEVFGAGLKMWKS